MKNLSEKLSIPLTIIFIWILAYSLVIYGQSNSTERKIEQRKSLEKRRERIQKLTLPHYEDYIKYRNFWRKRPKRYLGEYWDKKGIFRLFPSGDCEKKYVITADDPCINYIAFLTSYNFRISNYLRENQIEDDYDLKFTGETLISRAFLNQGMLVALGKIDIREVSLSSPGMKFLTDFQPAKDKKSAQVQFKQISTGIQKDRFYYSNEVEPILEMTYALRVVPYRIEVENRSLKAEKFAKIADPKDSKIYHQFRNIKQTQRLLLRLDSIFVFKIIRVSDEDQGLTIVWKRLLKQKSPRLHFEEDEELKDFK